MKIYPVNNQYYASNTRQNYSNNINFGAGTFRFLALSDLHGGLRSQARLVRSIETNFDTIFPTQKNGESTGNFVTIAGD